jgi:hypothetical protein
MWRSDRELCLSFQVCSRCGLAERHASETQARNRNGEGPSQLQTHPQQQQQRAREKMSSPLVGGAETGPSPGLIPTAIDAPQSSHFNGHDSSTGSASFRARGHGHGHGLQETGRSPLPRVIDPNESSHQPHRLSDHHHHHHQFQQQQYPGRVPYISSARPARPRAEVDSPAISEAA